MVAGSGQYATDANLLARQRLWQFQEPPFDLFAWVLDLAGAHPGCRVLDAGCGNGSYLARLRARGAAPIGCDVSPGMLAAVARPAALVNADAQRLPFSAASFNVVLAAHMLYHVPDQQLAAREMRRVLVPGGICVVVTNGSDHIRSLRQLVETVVHRSDPGWTMVDWATSAFSLDKGREVLESAFERVDVVRPPVTTTVVITEAGVVADYVASVADAYQDQVTGDWADVVEATRRSAQEIIDRDGRFTTKGVTGAFVCQ